MMDRFDVLLVDLQDVGSRIYTFVTTLRYVLEAAAQHGKAVWVLDRPNPIGRPVEGLRLRPGWESFVGAGPLPMRHGLTLGELARWFVRDAPPRRRVRGRRDGRLGAGGAPGFGWPLGERAWVNPSPNAAEPRGWRAAIPGTVMLEGTTLSEGRGTTRPLEVLGAPDLDAARPDRDDACARARLAAGCRLRPCWFEPTFHKHAGQLCAGLQIHVDDAAYDHERFRPWRLVALAFKALRALAPDYPLWRDFAYEYEHGGSRSTSSTAAACCASGSTTRPRRPPTSTRCRAPDEDAWREEREAVLLYRDLSARPAQLTAGEEPETTPPGQSGRSGAGMMLTGGHMRFLFINPSTRSRSFPPRRSASAISRRRSSGPASRSESTTWW